MKADHLPGRIASTASRVPRVALAVALSLPLLLLLALAFALVSATPSRAVEAVACTGQDLLPGLKTEHPERYAAAIAAAGATANGRGRLWKIDRPGLAPSWLFGTMHVTDPRVTAMPEAARESFEASGTVVIETVDILDPVKAQGALLARPELTMFTDGTTLSSLLEAEDLKLLRSELDRRGIPLALVSRMKPWMIATMVALPDCEHANKSAGIHFLDRQIAEGAQADGKTLLGLESISEQLAAMESLPIDFHIRGLIETIRLGDMLPDIMATMTELYLAGEIALMMPVIQAAMPEGREDEAEHYARFEERMIRMRNHVMAERADPILKDGNAFIALGALHLPGDEGVVSLLRKAGYTVTAVD